VTTTGELNQLTSTSWRVARPAVAHSIGSAYCRISGALNCMSVPLGPRVMRYQVFDQGASPRMHQGLEAQDQHAWNGIDIDTRVCTRFRLPTSLIRSWVSLGRGWRRSIEGTMSVVGSVCSIYRYPVKSMAGEKLDEAAIGPGGLVGDRQWALRDFETGKLVSAKRPNRWGAMLECHAWYDGAGITHVELPSGMNFDIEDPAAAAALSGLFGREVTVERFREPGQGSYESDWPTIEGMVLSGQDGVEFPTNVGGDHTDGFVDVSPIHVTTTSGMRTLREANPSLVVDDRRFRPTIVIDTGTAEGFVENEWSGRDVEIGDIVISVDRPTFRCMMAVAAQNDLPHQKEVLKTLARINGNHVQLRLVDASGRGAHFGVWAGVAKPGPIRIGDVTRLPG
jgi:uncharacterized protein